jgi:hypothetical protein
MDLNQPPRFLARGIEPVQVLNFPELVERLLAGLQSRLLAEYEGEADMVGWSVLAELDYSAGL